MRKIQEWCPHCEEEVEITEENKYQECPECNTMIAPCSMYSHGEDGIHDCVCQTSIIKESVESVQELENFRNGVRNKLKNFLEQEIQMYEGYDKLSYEQVDNVVRGLEFYISDYLAEQVPELITNELEESEDE